MKLLFVSILCYSFLFGVEAKKDVDFNDLFSQLDKVISAKKDKGKIDKEKNAYRKESTSKRENNYKKFNEAAKKYHIFRASKIQVTVKKLIKQYSKQSVGKIKVYRYSNIGDKSFAYVSSLELNDMISKLQAKGKQLNKLHKYDNLLTDIKNYDIKTIAKVLIIVEQEIMNMMGMGIKKISLKTKASKKDAPISLEINKIFKNEIEVINIDKQTVTLKFLVS